MQARTLLNAPAGAAATCLCLAALALCGRAPPASACSIPVFCYALERWPAERYTMIVFHRGPLADGPRELIERLGETSSAAGALEVLVVDVSEGPEEPLRAVCEATEDRGLPRMVLCYPGRPSVRRIVWSGKLDAAAARSLLHSPARSEVARRIASGEAAVWVLLESGNREADEAAASLLESELRKMEEKLELPMLAPGGPADVEAGNEPKISFSVLRVSRADPAETTFVEMLVGSEWDLRKPKYAAQPMAFPVFGRGRALYALVGKGINEGNIWRTGRFLTGPCFCEVRAANPGIQLLFSVDWDGLTTGGPAFDEALPPLTGLPEPASPAEVPAAEADRAERRGALMRNVLIVSAFGLAVAAGGTFILRRKKRRR